MLSIKITDIKLFHDLLFKENAFDRFLFREGSFTTCISTHLDGALQEEYYKATDDTFVELPSKYQSWEKTRPLCFQIINGERMPISYKLVLLTDKKVTDSMCQKCDFHDCEVTSLSMNILYRSNEMFLTSGIAYNGFTMDKSVEKLWEQTICDFLNKKDCHYEN